MRATSCLRIPPAPQVMAQLFADYKRAMSRFKKKKSISFQDYLILIGFIDPSVELEHADEGAGRSLSVEGHLVEVPKTPVTGTLTLAVLLVDFADNVGMRPAQEFQDMLFSERAYLTGSMRDFYREASCGKVDIVGAVHGWLRMPQPYSYYVNGKQGFGAYPRNAPRLAEDAVKAAMAANVPFPAALDKLGHGSITGLFIVHAGPGAEVMPTLAQQNRYIWSHKSDMKNPVRISGTLSAVSYLMVPEDCRMGVCAHELGHLAFQWDDFYDPNYAEDGNEWDGAGSWDLMAGGSWNNGGSTPAHPAALHKSQHGWVDVQTITKSTKGIVVPPYTPGAGKVIQVKSPVFSKTQSLVLENRQRTGFDSALRGDGLLVWRVDTSLQQATSTKPAMLLVQADGRHNLEDPSDQNDGDAGDPFPGSANVKLLKDKGPVSTSFPSKASKVQLGNITRDATNGNIKLDVTIGK